MELELKHLAPYLPYGLRVKTEDGMFKVIGWVDDIGICLDTMYYGANAISTYKPILRPLSDLTKEIEHIGERFVPIKELHCMANDQTMFVSKRKRLYNSDLIIYSDGDFSKTSAVKGRETLDYFKIMIESIGGGIEGMLYESYTSTNNFEQRFGLNQIELLNKLLEWNFDVYGLIGAGLAIDINTLK